MVGKIAKIKNCKYLLYYPNEKKINVIFRFSVKFRFRKVEKG